MIPDRSRFSSPRRFIPGSRGHRSPTPPRPFRRCSPLAEQAATPQDDQAFSLAALAFAAAPPQSPATIANFIHTHRAQLRCPQEGECPTAQVMLQFVSNVTGVHQVFRYRVFCEKNTREVRALSFQRYGYLVHPEFLTHALHLDKLQESQVFPGSVVFRLPGAHRIRLDDTVFAGRRATVSLEREDQPWKEASLELIPSSGSIVQGLARLCSLHKLGQSYRCTIRNNDGSCTNMRENLFGVISLNTFTNRFLGHDFPSIFLSHNHGTAICQIENHSMIGVALRFSKK